MLLLSSFHWGKYPFLNEAAMSEQRTINAAHLQMRIYIFYRFDFVWYERSVQHLGIYELFSNQSNHCQPGGEQFEQFGGLYSCKKARLFLQED